MKALKKTYPKHEWEAWQFAKVEDGYWDDIENQREFLTSLQKTLSIYDMPQWYRVTSAEIKAHGGAGLLKRYQGSMRDMLVTVFYRHAWQEWRFHVKDSDSKYGGSEMQERQRSLRGFLDSIAVKLSLRVFDDWYRVSVKEVWPTATLYSHFGLIAMQYVGSF
jgi:hypothetical protein